MSYLPYIQEALGSRRRDKISTDDYGNNSKLSRFEQEKLERAREVNRVGSDAFLKAQENQPMLSSWNSNCHGVQYSSKKC